MVRHIFLPQPLNLSDPLDRIQIKTIPRFFCSLQWPSLHTQATWI